MTQPSVNRTNYSFFQTDRVILDTNIWLILYSPGPALIARANRTIEAYSRLYQNLIQRNVEILVPQIVLSEFINVYLKESYKHWRGSTQRSYKVFRASPAYQSYTKDIEQALQKIFKCAVSVDFEFTKHPPTSLMEELQRAQLDYADILLSRLCSDLEAILVTDDRDFQSCGKPIEIVTANNGWLQDLRD